jgi:hypothetical protein
MLTYVVVILVVAAMLYLSFRALGGGADVAAEAGRVTLARVCEGAAASAAELEAALRGEPAALAAAATALRKRVSGYQDQLGRVEVGDDEAERDVLDSARTLLSAGIEDLGWACRMLEAGNHAGNPGVQRAVVELRGAATECLVGAARLLGVGAAGGQCDSIAST